MKDLIKQIEGHIDNAQAAGIKRDLNTVVGSLTEGIRDLLELVKTLEAPAKPAAKKVVKKAPAKKPAAAKSKQTTPINLKD